MLCKLFVNNEIMTYKDVDSVTLPSITGELNIQNSHAECFAILQQGYILVKKNNTLIHKQPLKEGGCHVRNNELVIFALL